MAETILDGGPADVESQYTGPDGELRQDESNRDLLLHDGTTQGGYRFQSIANADARYQGKNPELDGFIGLNAQAKGFWVRRAPGDYRLRKITVNGANLDITNDDGFAGNPYLELAAVITSEHTWTGQHLFTDVVEFDAGINADVSGDLTGDVTGNVTGDLTGDSTGLHTGSVDVRGATLQLDDDQIPIRAVDGLSEALSNATLPVGCILIWSGDTSDVPTGFVLCDGENGTPDLTNSFILGAGDGVDIAAAHSTGGSSTHNHTIGMDAAGAHTHPINVANHALDISEMPAHVHGSGVTDNSPTDCFNHTAIAASPTTANSIESNSADGTYEGQTTSTGGGAGHNHTATSDSAGSHTHDLNPEEAEVLPPYYALCYIMRIAL